VPFEEGMRTCWEIHFEVRNVFLQRDQRFVWQFKPLQTIDATLPTEKFELLVVLDKEHRTQGPDGPDEAGRLLITVPGRPEHTEDLAAFLANELRERLSFPAGRMVLHWGFLQAERLPETSEEEAEIGDRPYWLRLTIKEEPATLSLRARQFPALNCPVQHATILRQFNAAREVGTPVERYLSFFKILERVYAAGGSNLLNAFRKNDALFRLVVDTLSDANPKTPPLTRPTYNDLLRKMVRTRHNCAHLKGKTGYSPGDPRIATEIQPLLGLVEELARRCIEAHIGQNECSPQNSAEPPDH
jgi:hypothetical protein